MVYLGKCGAQIEMYVDPDGAVIIQCAMGRGMSDCLSGLIPNDICINCEMAEEYLKLHTHWSDFSEFNK